MAQSIPTGLAAAESAAIQSSTSDALTIVLVGFLFVLFVLLLLAVVTWGMGVCFKRIVPQRNQPVFEEAKDLAREVAAQDEELELHEIAVVAAAIHCVFEDRAHRIVSIRTGDSGWAKEGRRQVFTSRRVR